MKQRFLRNELADLEHRTGTSVRALYDNAERVNKRIRTYLYVGVGLYVLLAVAFIIHLFLLH